MDQIGSGSRQKIKVEVNFPSELIFHKNAEDPEKDRVTEKVPEIAMKKHRGDDLPGILLTRGRIKIAPDPEPSLNITPMKGEKNEPIRQEEADRYPREILSGEICSDRNHN
jgi:hypothetical protein